MTKQDAVWAIQKALEGKGFSFTKTNPDTYSGFLNAEGILVKVELEVPDPSFVQIPKIRVIDRSSLPVEIVAHIETGNSICYADKQHLRLDAYNPGGAILRVLLEAENALKKSLGGNNVSEITEEFLMYWGAGNALGVEVVFDLEKKPSVGILAEDNSYPNIFLLTDKNGISSKSFKPLKSARLLYHDKPFVPLKGFIYPKTLNQLEDWLHHNTGSKRAYNEFIDDMYLDRCLFIHAENGWIGMRVELPADLKVLKKKSRPDGVTIKASLKKRADNILLTRYFGQDASLKSIGLRNINAGQGSLAGKKITLVGCGTIGSYLARFLVQTGAGCGEFITLVDNDLVQPGNLGRHLLNFGDLSEHKTIALKRELERFHPDVKIRTLNNDVSEIILQLDEQDIVIDATGVEVVSEFLNRHALDMRSKGETFNLLHSWIYGNGISAFSYLNIDDGFSCYRCLRPNLSAPWINDPRKNKAVEPFLTHAGCGEGPYVAYSVSASVQCAAISLDAVLDYFDEKPHPRLRSVVLNSEQGRSIKDKSPKKSISCPACNL